MLGNNIKKIAKEKGGIIKNNISVIIGRKQNEIKSQFQNIANKKKSTLQYAANHNFISGLKGNYQKENINTVVSAIKVMQKKKWKISNENIKNGLLKTIQNTGLLGRWQILGRHPLIICDTGHNEEGIKMIFKQIQKTQYKNLHIVFGVVIDKDLDSILYQLPKNATYYFCQPNIEKGLNPKILQVSARKKGLLGSTYDSVKKALTKAKKIAEIQDLIFIGGSNFVVAEII